MTITESMCLFGQHNASILRYDLTPLEVFDDQQSCQRPSEKIENFVRESNNIIRDTSHIPLDTKCFLREAIFCYDHKKSY